MCLPTKFWLFLVLVWESDLVSSSQHKAFVLKDDNVNASHSEELHLVLSTLSLNPEELEVQLFLEPSYIVTKENCSLIVVASHSEATLASLGTKLRGVEVGVVVWDYRLFNYLGLTDENQRPGSSSQGLTSGTGILVKPQNLLDLEGLIDDVEVYTSSGSLSWGSPSSDAVIVATTVEKKGTIFAYEEGDKMAFGHAPGRRIGFFLDKVENLDILTDHGKILLSACLDWTSRTASTPDWLALWALLFAALLGVVILIVAIYLVVRKWRRKYSFNYPKRRPQNSFEPSSKLMDLPAIHSKPSVTFLSDIKVGNMIGAGNFSEVYHGLWLNKTDVALKRLKDHEFESFIKEVTTLSHLNHPNIIRIYGLFEDPHINMEYIVLEYAPRGTLLKVLKEEGSKLKMDDLVEIILQVAAGMTYLASKKVLHRDLAARNVLVSDSGGSYTLKISDFGMSRTAKYTLDVYEAVKKDFPYRWSPPEVIESARFSLKSDVWSFGVLMWEVFKKTGEQPYKKLSNADTCSAVCRGERLTKPKGCPNEFYAIMLRCWNHEPEKRPDFKTLLADIHYISKPRRKQESSFMMKEDTNTLEASENTISQPSLASEEGNNSISLHKAGGEESQLRYTPSEEGIYFEDLKQKDVSIGISEEEVALSKSEEKVPEEPVYSAQVWRDPIGNQH